MKQIFKKLITMLVTGAARILIYRHRPEIIGITGSGGKTTTKEFLRSLLEIDFEVMAPREGYNTEIGAPLSFFEQKVPEKLDSFFAWFLLLISIYKKALFSKDYPDILIVEMGADKPGDIKYLTRVFPPSKGIVLSVLNTHLEEFKTIEHVAVEKSEMVKAVGEKGKVYLNADDKRVKEMAELTKAKVIFFGTEESGGYVAENLKSDINGLRFSLRAGSKKYHMAAPLFGAHMIYPLMAAIAVARSMHISMDKIRDKVKTLQPFKGRMNVIEGIEGSIIIDDTYNANPNSMVLALDFLSQNAGRKIAILGSMNELGDTEEEAHQLVGRSAAKSVDILVTVGEAAQKYLAKEAVKKGLKNVKSFKSSVEAGKYLKDIVKNGDIILAKGSQNKVRVEKAVEILMAHPENKNEILVRQSLFWKDR
jgi:UDP-N-acetylmuramoyl-tripeptide--D-alanyl-D-alanine ligase